MANPGGVERRRLETQVKSFDPRDGHQQLAISKAAWQLEDAIKEKVCDQYPDTLESRQMFFDVIYAQKWHDRALMAMILITIFETPTWCDTSQTWAWGIDPQDRCLVYGDKGQPIKVLLSGINYVPPGVSILGEVAILATLLYKLWLEYRMQVTYFEPLKKTKQEAEHEEEVKQAASHEHSHKKHHGKESEHEEEKHEAGEYFPVWKIYFCVSMIVLNLLDVLIFALFRPQMRIAFLSRTALLCMLPSVIKLYKCISKILIEVGTVAVFFVGFLFFFAWVSVTIFNGMPEKETPEDFATFGKAFYGLFVAGVCDEFPDVLLQSYTKYRGIGVLWFVFLLVVHLLFLSLVLDTLCAGYMKTKEDETETVREEKAKGVLKAFSLLSEATCDRPHKLHKDVFMAVISEYCKSPGVKNKADVYTEAYFHMEEDKKWLDETEFCEMLALTQYNMWITRKDSKLQEKFPDLWKTPCVKDVRNPDGTFENIMMIVLSINFVLVVIETTYDLNDVAEPSWTEWLEFVFSFVYLGECMIKIGTTGWDFYMSTPSNKFDFMTTMLLLATSIFESVLGSLSTYANILRLFRLLRIVKQLKSLEGVQFMADTVIKLVCKAQDMLVLLLVVIFGFTVFSVQLFGGLLYEENKLLEGTSYHEEKEFVLNFNDFLMAFGLWFVNLLCEYKPSFAEAVDRTSPIYKSWLLFGLFWAIAVCITFELVKAFTIEVYMDLRERWEIKVKEKAKMRPEKKSRMAFLTGKGKVNEDEGKEGEDEEEEDEREAGSMTPEVLKVISKYFKAQNPPMVFWYTCVNVDEDEWEEVTDVMNEINEKANEHGEEHEHGEEEETHGH